MKGILPAILAHTKAELHTQLAHLTWAKRVQLDIMDGRFVPKRTFNLNETLPLLRGKAVQAHLMVRQPKRYLRKLAHVKEIIYHAETGQDLIEDITALGPRAGISLNPNSKIKPYTDLIRRADIAQVMTVTPGKMGQAFLHGQLRKIAQIKKINPHITVGVDGGVNARTITHAFQAGADYVAVGSALHQAPQPRKKYLLLRKNATH